jgi:hypothetical protein
MRDVHYASAGWTLDDLACCADALLREPVEAQALKVR